MQAAQPLAHGRAKESVPLPREAPAVLPQDVLGHVQGILNLSARELDDILAVGSG